MWYSEGTVAVDNGSTNIVGTGTSFLTNARVGDGITITGSTALHEIIGVASNTQISIRPAYDGPTGAGLTYGISPLLGYDKDLSDAFNSLRLQFGEQLSNLQPWAYADTTQEARTALGASDSGNTIFTGTPEESRAALGASLSGEAVFTGTPEEGREALGLGSPVLKRVWSASTVGSLDSIEAEEGDQASVADVGLFELTAEGWEQQDASNQLVTSSTSTQTVAEALEDRLSVINVENYGADESGDNTTAITNAVAASLISGSPVFWNYGKTYPASDNIPNLLSVKHVGSATIERGVDSYHIGHLLTGVDNNIYVSASGSSSNDGIAATEPLDLTTGFTLLKQQAARNPQVKWTFKLAAGTYPDGPSRRFDDFPLTSQPVDFIGEKDGSEVPTTIFNAWTTSVFRKIGGAEGILLYFQDMKFTDCTETALFLWHGCSIDTKNLHSDGHTAPPFSYRRGRVSHRGGRIENGDGGVIFQDCYGDVGDNRPPTGANKIVFNGITNVDGSSVCVDVSRGSVAYAVNCDFGLDTACDVHISESRLARCRTVGNNHGAFNTAILSQEGPLCLFNDDLANIDDFSLSGATVGDTPIKSSVGSYFSRFTNGLNIVGHLSFRGPAYTLTGSTRTLVSAAEAGLVPFRMPAVWLMSPTSTGIVEYEIRTDTAETVLFEINGVAAGTGQRLAACSFTTSAGARYIVRIEITGPLVGQTIGRYNATVTGANAVQTAFGATAGLNQAVITSPSLAEQPFRLYITRSNGAGSFDILRATSWTSM